MRVRWNLRRTPISGTRAVLGWRTLRRHRSFAQPIGNSRPSKPADRLVDVGDDDHERGGFAVDLGDLDQLRIDEKAQVPAELVEFGGGERHEPPVLRPGVVEDVAQQRDLVVEALAVERPHPHAMRGGGDQPRHDRRRLRNPT